MTTLFAAINTYPDVLYCAVAPSTIDVENTSAADFDGALTLVEGDRVLVQSGANAGVYLVHIGFFTTLTIDPHFSVWEGATVQCIRSAGSPVFQQTAATGAATPVFALRSDPTITMFSPSGAADDWTRLNALIAAGHKRIQFTPGVYFANVPGDILSDTKIYMGPAVEIRQTMPDGWGNAALSTRRSVPVAELRVSTVIAEGDRVIAVKNLTVPGKLIVGNYLGIGSVLDPSAVGIYRIVKIIGSSSPWTVTLDRPVLRARVEDDYISIYEQVTNNVAIYANGATISGTGDRLVHFGTSAINCRVYDLLMTDDTGQVSGPVLSFDVTSYRCFAVRCSVLFSAMTVNSIGFYSEHGESNHFTRCVASGVDCQYWLADSTRCRMIECKGVGVLGAATSQVGVYIGTGVASTTTSCIGCTIEGGEFSNNINNIVVTDKSRGTLIRSVYAAMSTQSNYSVKGNAVDTKFVSSDGVKAGNGYGSFCETATINTRIVNCSDRLSQRALQGDNIDVDGFVIEQNAALGNGYILLGAAGSFSRINRLSSRFYVASTAHILINNGAKLKLTNSELIDVAGGVGLNISADSTVEASNSYTTGMGSGGVAVTGAGTFVDAGGNDFGTATTLFSQTPGQVVKMQQRGGVAAVTTTGAEKALTHEQAQCREITTAGVLGSDTTVTVPTCPGNEYYCTNNNTGAFTTTFKSALAGDSGVAVTQGTTVKCRINAVGNMVVA